jgi:hypothetical protein
MKMNKSLSRFTKNPITKYLYQSALIVGITICLVNCKKDISQDSNPTQSKTLFTKMDNKAVGIDFTNKLIDSPEFNVYKYRNFYNGGGVAIGDINNDGLVDIYMVSNQDKNRLYLNKGNWKFEDITEKSGTSGSKAWSTGVTMADVNGDGFLDIYVCNSGDIKGSDKENELFINNGDLTFEDKAAEYGLNDKGYSTHATFFDYDKDGDLDCYILNNSFKAIGSFNLKKNERPIRDELGGDKLMRNDGKKFVDVSEKAGIYGSVIGFGLGITIGDVNNDNWEDIYISNDFFERDYLYINQRNGKFSEQLTSRIQSISAASMGADIADINNDGNNEIFVTDMLPNEYQRLKTVTTFDDWDRYMYGVNNGYYHQFTRNTLQRNNGDGTFSEISRYSGVEASDWSWGALFFDMDLDGLKDLFIANGIYRDLTDQDYLQYVSNESVMHSIIQNDGVNYKKLIDTIPSRPVPNQVYRNNGDFLFTKYTDSGLIEPSFSNGSAYGDLDNDGDLDLVVNNVNMPCFLYQNHARQQAPAPHYLKLDLKGENKNKKAIGAKILVKAQNNQQFYYENQPSRGFESCMDGRVNIGLGANNICDLEIIWPSGKQSIIQNVKADQILTLEEKDAKLIVKTKSLDNFSGIQKQNVLFEYSHRENPFVDFNQERLNYHMMSTQGPKVAFADINGDKKKDFLIPGPKGQPSTVWIYKDNKYFLDQTQKDLEALASSEHIKALLFDVDNDGDNDAYLASGSVESSEYSDELYDHLLINDGKGMYINSGQRLPKSDNRISTGAAVYGDIDADGDQDLLVGERVKVNNYGAPTSIYILENNGKGIFKDVTLQRCPELSNIGMTTDIQLLDLDGDKMLDIVVVGEFMDINIFKNKAKKFEKVKHDNLSGWWNTICPVDIDNDGDADLIIGNHGLNSRFKADEKHPISLFHYDYDQNGMAEAIMSCTLDDGKKYPVALRHNLMMRLPGLKKKYPNFESFRNASMEDIFGNELLKKAHIMEAVRFSSIVLRNDGNMKFTAIDLPYTTQLSPIYTIACHDVNNDGFKDLILGGNLYGVQPEMGRYDASNGQLLINNKKGNFIDQSLKAGLNINGALRSILIDDKYIHFFKNNDRAESYLLSEIADRLK